MSARTEQDPDGVGRGATARACVSHVTNQGLCGAGAAGASTTAVALVRPVRRCLTLSRHQR